MMARPTFARELRAVLQEVDCLPEQDVESISVLIEAGEWEVALETLCTQIHEYDCDPPRAVHDELRRLGRQLGVAAGFLLGDPWEEPS